jgi:vesicle-fusing ATPase
VSTADFLPPRDGSDLQLLVKDLYVLSARALDDFPPGCISLSDPQRTWAKVALTDSVKVQPFDPSSQGGLTTLVSVDMEVGFAGKKRTDSPYDQNELARAVTSVGFAIDTIADNANIQ